MIKLKRLFIALWNLDFYLKWGNEWLDGKMPLPEKSDLAKKKKKEPLTNKPLATPPAQRPQAYPGTGAIVFECSKGHRFRDHVHYGHIKEEECCIVCGDNKLSVVS